MWLLNKILPTSLNGTYPSKAWIKDNPPVSGFTWDMPKLEQCAHQPVFIYNQMKRRHRSFAMIEPWSEFRGRAFTANENWIMWKKKLGKGTFPIAMRIEHTMVPTARIAGELYLINSYRIKDLDEFMSNGVEFRRKQVQVLVPYARKTYVHGDPVDIQAVAKVSAWMYIGRYKYWEEFLDAGYHFKPCSRYSPKGFVLQGQYYDFTELEFEGDDPLVM